MESQQRGRGVELIFGTTLWKLRKVQPTRGFPKRCTRKFWELRKLKSTEVFLQRCWRRFLDISIQKTSRLQSLFANGEIVNHVVTFNVRIIQMC